MIVDYNELLIITWLKVYNNLNKIFLKNPLKPSWVRDGSDPNP